MPCTNLPGARQSLNVERVLTEMRYPWTSVIERPKVFDFPFFLFSIERSIAHSGRGNASGNGGVSFLGEDFVFVMKMPFELVCCFCAIACLHNDEVRLDPESMYKRLGGSSEARRSRMRSFRMKDFFCTFVLDCIHPVS
jgi:hypothetical protein